MPSRFDRFEILGPLGVGGMGEVVKARALGPHGFEKVVAIKRIRAEWAQQEAMAERFIREARIAARLQHANVVHVFDFGRHDDELFIVMEFVDGQSLDDILAGLREKGKRLTLAQTLQIALDVARALESAHGLTDADGAIEAVIHRDVSPANVLVSRSGVVKLTDFGIAAVASQQARTSMVAGKPLYMAPEQLRGDALDPRADLFAVGYLIYEMITGERPWKGMVDTSRDATLEGMGYRAPSQLLTGIPPEVDALVEHLLQPDRELRTASAEELAQELVKVSYKCHIVLDPAELRPLVQDQVSVGHAATLPSHPSKPETLIATVSAEGVTLLATGPTEARVSQANPTPTTEREAAVGPTGKSMLWMAVALVLVVIGAGAAGWALNEGDGEPVAEHDRARDAEARRERSDRGARDRHRADRERSDRAQTSVNVEHGHDAVTAPQPVAEVGAEVEPEVGAPAEAALTEAATSTTGGARRARRSAREGDTGESAQAPPRVATGEPGELDVFTRPWAEIYVDGVRQTQNAPARGIQLPSGRHRIRLVNPVAGLSAERTVDIPAGGRAQLRVFLDAPDEGG